MRMRMKPSSGLPDTHTPIPRIYPHSYSLTKLIHYDLICISCREVIKHGGGNYGMNRRRVHLRGFRTGCCMTSSPDAFVNPGEMAANVQQQFQGWAPGGQQPYARGLMGIGMIKSILLNRIRDMRLVSIGSNLWNRETLSLPYKCRRQGQQPNGDGRHT